MDMKEERGGIFFQYKKKTAEQSNHSSNSLILLFIYLDKGFIINKGRNIIFFLVSQKAEFPGCNSEGRNF